MRTRARTGPRSSTRTVTASGRVHERVLSWGGVVVGVAKVAAVDQPAVAGRAVEREGPGRRVDVHAHQPVGDHDRTLGLADLDGMGQRRRLEGRPAVPRHLAGAGEDLARRRLLHAHADHGVGPGPEPRVDVLLRLCDGDVGLLLGADGDGDVEALLGVFDQHVVDPRLVVDPRPLHHPQHRADRVRIEHHRSGQPGPLGHHLHVGGGRAVRGDDQLHDTGAGPLRRVEQRGADVGERAGKALDGAVGQPGGDRTGLGVPVQHGVDDVVDRAGTDGVVGGVAHHLQPGQFQQALRVVRRRLEQGGQWLGAALQFPLGERAAALDVDPVRGHAHEHVGPGAGAQLALHPRESLGGGVGQVAGDRGHLEVELVLQVVGLGHDPAEPGLGHQVVGPVHAQQVAHEELGHLGHVVPRAADERLGVVGQRRTVAVADGQVLGPDRGAVGGLPDEGVLGHLLTARPARRRRRGSRPAGGSGASAQCGRTCRAGSPAP